jgi:hypothetical protein
VDAGAAQKQFEWLLRATNYRGGASFGAFIQMIRTTPRRR